MTYIKFINKSKMTVILLIIVAILVSAIIYWGNDSEPSEIVVMIDKSIVTADEFKFFMNDEISNTYVYFKRKYNMDDSPSFWTTEVNNETPIDYIKEKTLNKIISIKVEQILALEYGLVDSIEYSSFLDKLEEENKRRLEHTEQGKVIYGPQQYNARQYFGYLHSNMVIKIKEEINKNLEDNKKTEDIDIIYEERIEKLIDNSKITVYESQLEKIKIR